MSVLPFVLSVMRMEIQPRFQLRLRVHELPFIFEGLALSLLHGICCMLARDPVVFATARQQSLLLYHRYCYTIN